MRHGCAGIKGRAESRTWFALDDEKGCAGECLRPGRLVRLLDNTWEEPRPRQGQVLRSRSRWSHSVLVGEELGEFHLLEASRRRGAKQLAQGLHIRALPTRQRVAVQCCLVLFFPPASTPGSPLTAHDSQGLPGSHLRAPPSKPHATAR